MLENIDEVYLRYLKLLREYRDWKKEVDRQIPNSDYTKKTLPPVYWPIIDVWEMKLGLARDLLGIELPEFEALNNPEAVI